MRVNIVRNFAVNYNYEGKWTAKLKSTNPNVPALMSHAPEKGNAVSVFATIGSVVSSLVAYSLLK